MLEARALTCSRGPRRLFHDLSFSVGAGEVLELRGRNGSGKTSLLRMLCGLIEPTEGVVLWRGAPIHYCRREYLASMTYVGHRPAVKEELTALENLRLACGLRGFQLDEREGRQVLQRWDLGGHTDTHVRQLSEGQRRRLALARLTASDSTVWLLDEVLTALDTHAVREHSRLLSRHLTNGGLAVIATHQDLGIAAPTLRRIELAA